MIPRRSVVLGEIAVWLGALGVFAAAAGNRVEIFRDAEERQAAADPEGVYAAAEQARGVTEPLSVADLRSKVLDTDQVLLEYLVGADATLIVLVSQDRCRAVRVGIGEACLGGLALALASGLYTGEAVPIGARALHELMIDPLAADVPPEARLVVSPDGPLDRVPFATLYDGTTFLVERHALSSTPSASSLKSAPRGGSITTLSLGGEATSTPPPTLKDDLPKDVAMQHVQRAAIGEGEPPRDWAAYVATGRMHAPRRPSGEFPAWIVPIGMGLGVVILVLALRRIPRTTELP